MFLSPWIPSIASEEPLKIEISSQSGMERGYGGKLGINLSGFH